MRHGIFLWIVLGGLVGGCEGSRDAHDLATDLEGTVSETTPARILQDVDLTQVPLTLSVAGENIHRYGPNDQQDLEDYLRDAARQSDGAQVSIVQEVLDESGSVLHDTLNLRVRWQGEDRYVPVVLELTRVGRRLLISRARVMLAR